MDKAPDAFRTISEVADDLDIPQHVLRFWETRFTQIKPMKRSGGRRYYRPDDVDLLRGIRRLLYGEGYTIRGVQRILKENGIKAVQGLVDGAPAPGFAAPGGDAKPRLADRGRDDDEDDVADSAMEVEAEDVDDEEEEEVEEAVEAPVAARREPVIAAPPPRREPQPAAPVAAPVVARPSPAAIEARRRDRARLEAALRDLQACREILDQALKDG
ncbi:MerR family transcriptional regulator [Rhodopseudomonas sp. P2A-2r]|uniref:MerR family transcriptional regulator n=1 Tax=Rhodopseudomonas sp. P2A-2r TaxID=2991972 RepID=UPI002234BF1C|nr:MerR family transcriptional regulator [Rhodopseudomonas sp. P2A-2r]UZE51864.1 MerR family transcriptional regulator [Rhodopseudomonas sp. P2A-2r]